MFELKIVKNEMMSYQENLSQSAWLTKMQYTISDNSLILFSPKGDGEHQYQVTITRDFSDFINTEGENPDLFVAPVEPTEAVESASASPINDVVLLDFGSNSPTFDLISPEVTGHSQFLTSDSELPKMMVCSEEQHSVIMFPSDDQELWPALIYPNEAVEPAFLTHPPAEDVQEIELLGVLGQNDMPDFII